MCVCPCALASYAWCRAANAHHPFPERATDRIINKGLAILLSFGNDDTMRLTRFPSLIDPATDIGGRMGARSGSEHGSCYEMVSGQGGLV